MMAAAPVPAETAPPPPDTWAAAARAAAVADAAPWARTLRTAAVEQVARLGWPSRRSPGWAHTDVRTLVAPPLAPAEAPTAAPATAADAALTACLAVLPPLGGDRLVFVDGHLTGGAGAARAGITVLPLAAATREGGAAAAAWVGRTDGHHRDVFNALNTATLQDGALVVLAAGARPPPLELIFVTTARPGAEACLAQPRVVVVAEAGSEGTVVERYVASGAAAGVTNAVTEIVVRPGARLAHVVIQEQAEATTHIAHLEAQIEADGALQTCVVAAGGRVARHQARVRLMGARAHAHLTGVAVARGDGRRDVQVAAVHEQPGGKSEQNFRGIFADRAAGAFGGEVRVEVDAQQTVARQLSKNLLLSPGATAFAQPQLTILADDVACNHGATVGAISADALFYLASRGIAAPQARQMLTVAFAREALQALPAALATAATGAVCRGLGLPEEGT